VSARSLIVYAVTGRDGSVYFATLREAITYAKAEVAADPDNAPHTEVQRITIPGPFNRDLVCRLLSYGGYAGAVDTIWPPRAGNKGVWSSTTTTEGTRS
jgi:hypothetical protein